MLVGLVVHHSALEDVARSVKSPVGRSCEEPVKCEEPTAGRRSRRAPRTAAGRVAAARASAVVGRRAGEEDEKGRGRGSRPLHASLTCSVTH